MTTKLHAAVSGGGRLLRLVVTAGQRGDAPQAGALLEGLAPRHVVADVACDSNAIRGLIRGRGGLACIRPSPSRVLDRHYDAVRYRRRQVIERFFRRIKECRRVATRHETKATNFASFVWLAAGVTA